MTFQQWLRVFLVGVVTGLLLAGGVCAWKTWRPSLPSIPAPPAAELAHEKPVTLDCRSVAVYPDRVKKNLGLPAEVRRDPSQHVAGSARIPLDEHPHTVTAVYSEGTGRVDMFVRRDPLPWLALERRWQGGLIYGLNDDAETVVRLQGQYDMVRLKRLHLGVAGGIETGGRYLVGIGLMFR